MSARESGRPLARVRTCGKTLCSVPWRSMLRATHAGAWRVDVGARARFSKLAALAASRHRSNRASEVSWGRAAAANAAKPAKVSMM